MALPASNVSLVREINLAEGSLEGKRIIEVRLPDGPSFDVLADRGLDIGDLWFGGQPVSWRSPLRAAADGVEFARRFTGGMLWTCGPDNIGPARDGLPMHGSHHGTPAVDVQWASSPTPEREPVISVSGTISVSTLFGSRIVTRRTITASGSQGINVSDVVTNEGANPTPLPLLYHLNFGAPFLAEGTSVTPNFVGTVVPRDEASPEHFAAIYPAATEDIREHVYKYVHLPEGIAELRLRTPSSRTEVTVQWRTEKLSRLYQWIWPSTYGHVLGIEPSTAPLFGPESDAAEPNTPILAPCTSISTGIQLLFTHM